MPIEWISAAGTALEWGPRLLDFFEQRGSPYASEEFVEKYALCLQGAIDLLPDVKQFSALQVQAGAVGVLKHMASVIHAYHGAKGNVDVNANIMMPEPTSEELLRQARFCRQDRKAESLKCFLVLKTWATQTDSLPRSIVLPVENHEGGDALLCGAPHAYLMNKAHIVNDTTRWDLAGDHESHKVKVELHDYFEQHQEQFRSFVSIPIAPPLADNYKPPRGCSDGVMGVVNIQCSKKNILGRVVANQRKLLLVLVPLVHVLAYYLLRMNALSGEPLAN